MFSRDLFKDKEGFVSNEYLDKYIELLNLNVDRQVERFKTQKHHVIPRYYYRLHNQPQDDSSANLVNLLYKDHVLAHYYLSLCTEGKLKYANQTAMYHVLGNINYLKNPEYLQELYVLTQLEKWQELGEEMAKTRSTLYTGRHCQNNTEEHKRQISLKNRGNIYVRKKVKGKWQSKKTRSVEEFQQALQEGWEKGNIPRSACKNDVGKAISQAKKGKICVNNGIINKYVTKEELDSYLRSGWLKGTHPPFVRPRVTIHKLGVYKSIFKDDLKTYQERGWDICDDR